MFSNSPSLESILSLNLDEKTQPQEQFISFSLMPDTYLALPIIETTEVIKFPTEKIIPIPHLPSWLMGVYNWRGEVLWMIDLGDLLGLSPWYEANYTAGLHQAIVLNHQYRDSGKVSNQNLGIVVNQVEDINRFNLGDIKDIVSGMVNEQLANFVEGYWLEPTGEMLLLLDKEAIIAAMP